MSARATGSASTSAGASPRWSTGSRPSSRPNRVVLQGDGIRRDGVDDIRFERDGDAAHASTTPRTSSSAGCLRFIQPFLGGAFRKPRPQRRRGDARDARAPRDVGRPPVARPGSDASPMRVAIVGSGVSGLSAAYALDRPATTSGLFEGDAAAGGHVKTVEVDDRTRSARRRHGLHRLQRAHLPDLRPAARGSRRRDPAERHVARVDVPGLRCRVQLARAARAVRPARARWRDRPTVRMFADVLRFYRDARARARRPGAHATRRSASTSTIAGSGRGSGTTSSCRSPRPCGRPPPTGSLEFPVDYLLRFLDHHGLIGVGNALQWRTITRRLDDLCRSDRSRALGADAVRAGDPVVGRHAGRRSARRSGRAGGRHERSTPSSWRPTPTTRCRPAARCRRPRADRPRRLRVLDQRGRAAHGRAAHAPSARCLGVVERRPGGLRSTGRGPHDDLPHEPAPVAARPDRLLRVGQPGRPSSTTSTVIAGSGDAPPAVHGADPRRPGRSCATSRAGARRTTLARISATGFHEDGCRSGFEVARPSWRSTQEERAA